MTSVPGFFVGIDFKHRLFVIKKPDITYETGWLKDFEDHFTEFGDSYDQEPGLYLAEFVVEGVIGREDDWEGEYYFTGFKAIETEYKDHNGVLNLV